ncbi:uncharacterized protein Z520_06910 [Fonsecaea multimorphosa CBS 102226]|uniref:non-specific serine/threonine protein kinase n=1 Tax=Fonsecaea multimorphosa CBS 102226 TaxID=1442371 RepID=A0A0D2KLF5_9EURO|nr:uncharacterized protein Z520_06910 [Fonsecaea multimorphosa CBS 102226]KIX97458.1 hypothetical protein Z520_06910 [Fonsecaea multimorphosa CBS 102226]
MLEEEAEIYRSLAGWPGFPQVYWYGQQDDLMVLVFELLGPNLEDLFRYCGDRFSLKTTLMLADQLLRRFETLHSHHFLHRDIKPENFLLGTGRRGNTVYMTDLGLAVYHRPGRSRPYSSPNRYETTRPPLLLGTCRYASIKGHLGEAQSPRDDLEALGYMLVYFLRGKLPWQGLKADKAAKHLLVLEMKRATTPSTLCDGLPAAFEEYMTYVQNLNDNDRPDYRALRAMFDQVFRAEGFEHDNVFDWTLREFQKLESAAPELPTSQDSAHLRAVNDTSSPHNEIPEKPEPRRSRRR